jgi:hypothetical protein
MPNCLHVGLTMCLWHCLLQILPWFVVCFWEAWCGDSGCETQSTYKQVGSNPCPLAPAQRARVSDCAPACVLIKDMHSVIAEHAKVE